MQKLILISGVCGVGKSTICEYINNQRLLKDYAIFDIDVLENINNYDETTYNFFYENAIKNAIPLSENKNIIIGTCINPSDLEKINIPKEIESYINILITCSDEILKRRLKARDKNRNCSSDEFIEGQISYQQYLLNHIELYQFHIDNTSDTIENISNKLVDYIERRL